MIEIPKNSSHLMSWGTDRSQENQKAPQGSRELGMAESKEGELSIEVGALLPFSPVPGLRPGMGTMPWTVNNNFCC